VAKEARSELVAEQHHGLSARAVLVFRKCAAGDGPDAQDFEKLPGGAGGADLLRIAVAGQAKRVIDAGGDGRVRAVVITDDIEKRKRQASPAAGGVEARAGEDHEAIRLGVRQRAQQKGIRYGENRRVRANAERQRQDGDQAKSGAFRQHARREPEILQHAFP
jgi:hypothetical protein